MTFWTDERKEVVGELLALGKTRAEIAAFFGKPRNSVCGLIDRIGGAKKARMVAAPRKPPSVRAKHLTPTPALAPIVCEPAPDGGLTIAALEAHHCRWPSGDPRDLDAFRYCGAAKAPHGPYCARHAALAITSEHRRATHGKARQEA